MGGFNPAPRRFGGRTSRVKLILDSLIAARGTSIDASDPNSIAYVEMLAIARMIAAAWNTNQRLANQWDAARMTSMLSRWEFILGLTPLPTDTIAARRHRIAIAQARVGRAAILTTIASELTDALGAMFVSVDFTSVDNAVITAPDGTYPFGVVVPGSPWSSSVAHILVLVQATGSEGDFYDAVGLIADRLEPLLPAWTTWNWYRAPEHGTPYAVPGGPSAGGFYLDERNLNESVFRI